MLNSAQYPERFRDFILVPDEKMLSRRPGTWIQAVFKGRESVRGKFEAEFRPVFTLFTTGRAAEPVPFFCTRRDMAVLAAAGKRVMEICGARREDRLLNAFPYAPHLAFWLTHYAGMEFGALMLSSGGGKVMNTDATLRLMAKLRPSDLIGVPTFLYHVLSQALAEKLRCEYLKNIVLGGEKAGEGLREKLRELARALGAEDVKILATYGFTEAKMAFAECPAPPGKSSCGYHLYPDLGIVEIVNPKTGEVVPNGQGG